MQTATLNVLPGWKTLKSGEAHATQGSLVLQRLGLSPEAAELLYGATQLAPVAVEAYLTGRAMNQVGSGVRVTALPSNVGVSEIVTAARGRQVSMLQDNVGFNISPIAWDKYPKIGRTGTYISDHQGIMGYFGDITGKSELTISPLLAAKIEKDLGLLSGSLKEGFKVRRIENIKKFQPNSPILGGNEHFLGAGNHLPSGAPEVVINSIPTVDNDFVKTILNIKIGEIR